MDKLLDKLELRMLLRCVMCGLAFIVAYHIIADSRESCNLRHFSIELDEEWHIGLLTGFFIYYGLHRSLIFPIIQCLMDSCWQHKDCTFSLIRQTTMDNLLKSWKAEESDPSKVQQNYMKKLSTWADRVHFLYTTSLGIALGIGVSVYLHGQYGSQYVCELLIFSLALFLLGLVSDWRYHAVRHRIYQCYPSQYLLP